LSGPRDHRAAPLNRTHLVYDVCGVEPGLWRVIRRDGRLTPVEAGTFRFHWSGIGARGPFEIAGRGTSVLVEHEGQLKILLEHLSR
jgi:hypothetical protein